MSVRVSAVCICIVRRIPSYRHRRYAWGVMAWQPSAWPLLNNQDPHTGYMMQVCSVHAARCRRHCLQAALKAGRRVDCVVSESRYYDCGTRSEYLQLASELWHQIESRQ